MKRKFREFLIERTCDKEYKQYQSYKAHLQKDFSCRCAYCNLLDSSVTTPFEVDHFIPRKTFQDVWPECDVLYDNLMYACKKCNQAKSSQYQGDITQRKISNEFFYNPVDIDYGTIFYRNDAGGIDSDDELGLQMIEKLKLYRPIHNLAWICEMLNTTLDKLNAKLEKVGRDTSTGQVLIQAKEELSDYYRTCQQVFIENYNNEKFSLHSIKEKNEDSRTEL